MLYGSTREPGVGSVPLRALDPLAIPGSIGSVGYTYGPKPHVPPSPFLRRVGCRDLIKTRTVCAQITIESVFDQVSAACGVSTIQMQSKGRRAEVVRAKRMFCAILREEI